ncbi:hypothetical protein B566_EDAN014977 [Ephemera danica]|nr:hypothetical protein B566_EDAN014977 [Ephemera danica]
MCFKFWLYLFRLSFAPPKIMVFIGSDETYVNGITILAETLQHQGIQYVFGFCDITTTELRRALQCVGIQFIETRSERSACYAAQAIGFLTQKPGVCLVRKKLGLLDVIGGIASATLNSWPLVVLGADERMATGNFEEYHNVDSCRLHCKYSARPANAFLIPQHVEKAVRLATYGNPGASYVELPATVLMQNTRHEKVVTASSAPRPPATLPDPVTISQAVNVLYPSKRPLLIVGPSAAYWRAEETILELVENTYIPVVMLPMAEGVVPDKHSQNVSSVRHKVLQTADVIILVGTKSNWRMHFGPTPRFNPRVKFIQIAADAADLHYNDYGSQVEIVCDLAKGVKALTCALLDEYFALHVASVWWTQLYAMCKQNNAALKQLSSISMAPLNSYAVFHHMQLLLPEDCMIVIDGATCMDVGRSLLQNRLPRHRLDAGTVEGAGPGFALAATVWAQHQGHQNVVCVTDALSTMELETMFRYQLPLIVIVLSSSDSCKTQNENSTRKSSELTKM